jgi:hypothetical protein
MFLLRRTHSSAALKDPVQVGQVGHLDEGHVLGADLRWNPRLYVNGVENIFSAHILCGVANLYVFGIKKFKK